MRLGMGNWFTDFLYNAETGNLSPAQLAQQQQQAVQQDIRAGANPAVAAQADPALINAALANTGPLPGPFGIPVTGALPTSTPWWTQDINAAESALANSAFGQGNWVWWALGGLGALWLFTRR